MFPFVTAPNIAKASRELTQQSFGQKIICGLFSHRYTVHVINDLPSNSKLRIHCASGDDDLGYHTLPVGYDFDWSFCDILWTTLFFCHLWWDSNSKERAFDVFNLRLAAGLCLETFKCFWSARGDGIYSSAFPSHEYNVTFYWRNMHTS
ncbi:hypothetical protein ACS0TY_031796 [Phlomoides rotata]